MCNVRLEFNSNSNPPLAAGFVFHKINTTYHNGSPLLSLTTVYVLGGMMIILRQINDDDTFELVSHSQTDKIRMLFYHLYLTTYLSAPLNRNLKSRVLSSTSSSSSHYSLSS
jgi:hypothetical protein